MNGPNAARIWGSVLLLECIFVSQRPPHSPTSLTPAATQRHRQLTLPNPNHTTRCPSEISSDTASPPSSLRSNLLPDCLDEPKFFGLHAQGHRKKQHFVHDEALRTRDSSQRKIPMTLPFSISKLLHSSKHHLEPNPMTQRASLDSQLTSFIP